MSWGLLDPDSRFFSYDVSEFSSVDIFELHGLINGELLYLFIFSKKELDLFIECGPHIFHGIFWSPVFILFVSAYSHLNHPVIFPYISVFIDSPFCTESLWSSCFCWGLDFCWCGLSWCRWSYIFRSDILILWFEIMGVILYV